MKEEFRPRRSVLYMPGANPRALEKATTLDADCLILDLEDATAPDRKDEARGLVADRLKNLDYGHRELLVRVNALDTPWGRDDLAAMAHAGAHGLLIPKVNNAADVLDVVALLAQHHVPDDLAIWVMMETPQAMLAAGEIAKAHPKLKGMVMGTNDLAKDLGAAHTMLRLPMITGLGLCMLAARAHNLAIIDGVFNDIQDEEALRASCQHGLEMGFDGKTLIHPNQLAPCNDVFAPDEAAIDLARRQVRAFDEAMAEGKAVAVVDNKIVENLHVAHARKILAMADAIAKRG
ncbi:MAG: CoA ester lyase [SAR116 cluster bacterium]|nr:MAG: CoA ester lyase [SAR116 cluster bacterium]